MRKLPSPPPNYALPQPVADEHGQHAAAEAEKQVEQRWEPVASRKEQDTAQGESAEGGIGTQEADVDKETARGSDQEGCVGQRGNKGKSKCPGDIDEQDVIGPGLAQVTLHKQAEQVARNSAEESTTRDGEEAATCRERSCHYNNPPSANPSAAAARPQSRLPPR